MISDLTYGPSYKAKALYEQYYSCCKIKGVIFSGMDIPGFFSTDISIKRNYTVF